MARFAAAFVCLALLAASASAQTEKWSQEKVTALSGQLASAVSGLQNGLQNGSQTWDPMMEDAVYQASDALGLFEFEATQLNALLKSGKGMKQTLPTYRRLQELHTELQAFKGQVGLSDFLKPPLDKAKAVLTQLAAYYPAKS